jgi:GT2 family glycosyltransferase
MSAARVSVVVPVHGRPGLTRRCLDLVLADLPTGCEVVVVDDASPAGSGPDDLAAPVRVLRLEENRGFAAACNLGAEAATGEMLVFLNNDTEPQPGWLLALVDEAERRPEAEAIGARLLYPTGAVQHAGIAIGQDGYPHNLYAGFPADHPAVIRPRRLQAVTGACMLVRRATFERVGGFDERFRNSLEDVDLCLRIGAGGGVVRYCPDAVLTHLESATRGREERFEASVALYRERWRDRVRRDDLDLYVEDGLIEVEYPDGHPLRISVSPLLAAIERSDGHQAELEPHLRGQGRRVETLQRELTRLAAELADRGVELEAPRLGYEDEVAEVRAAVERMVPEGASVLLVSRGDAELLRLGEREAGHFPAGPDGRYLGHHPAGDAEAIALLERAREGGAEYLVVPAAELWWLGHYAGFAAHLEERAVVERHGSCAVYRLAPRLVGEGVGS